MTNDYRTTAEMEQAHSGLRAQAIRFRITRLLEGEEAARGQLSADEAGRVACWHRLQAAEGAGLRAVA